ncbi:dihydrofolate reductase family protein [Cohnella silvisoli]|uniref:Dihydrofolate reductase family protein n=1 Tax=Cohnella silvisoli TaxID=2873699 RepID=A0ABV1KNI3_9BACL|nr:dihydrofolate reductase family protein [Cohnella silvisoli]MCD9021060.1 dihydrofolate reductase family protein [Cohnella silvisoli]
MGKITASIYLSLDGIMEEPGLWHMPYWDDEMANFQRDVFYGTDALLLGRVTYEGFAAAWPKMKGEGADEMNAMPKYVATTTLVEPQWNASFIKNNIAQEVTKLKQETDQQFLIYGSGQLIRTLMEHNLIDEYRFMVHPVVLGKGKRLFTEQGQRSLKLVGVKTTTTGVALLSYQPSE